MKELRLIFLGFGTVAQACARHLINKRQYLARAFGFRFKVVAISDIVKGSVQNPDEGIELSRVLRLVDSGGKLDVRNLRGSEGSSSMEVIETVGADLMVEATWTNLKDAEPATMHIAKALENGMDVVTSNKGPIALNLRKLQSIANAKGRRLMFESTVMSGTPVFNLREHGLLGAEIKELRGILNGTTNYILTEMHKGKAYEDALKQAQSLGFAEANPAGDVDGYDPAAKITILANVLMNGDVKFSEVEREGISQVTSDDIRRASSDAKRLKLIASAVRNGSNVIASVKPTLVPEHELLAHVEGIMNALQISTDVQPDITVIGPGAGGNSAGYGLLNDILTIHKFRVAGGE